MTKLPLQKKTVKPKNHGKNFFPIYPGILDYVERGDISPFQLGIYVMIHGQANYGTGIWMGSAPKILALAPRDTSLQSIQRALRHLVDLGLLKHFHVRGVRGNFAHLINKYKCRSGELMGQTLNAENSTSLDNIIYEGDAEGDALGDAERELLVTQGVTHLQEVRSEEVQEPKNKEKSGAAKPAAPDPSARLYIEKLKRLSDSVTDALIQRMQESWPDPPASCADIHKDFQLSADHEAIEYRDFQNLYRGAMRTAEWTVTPVELVGPGPITEQLIEKWTAQAASNPDVLEIIRDGGSDLTLVFADGIEEHYIGHVEPYWFPFDDEALQEKNVEEEPVVAHAMPEADPGTSHSTRVANHEA